MAGWLVCWPALTVKLQFKDDTSVLFLSRVHIIFFWPTKCILDSLATLFVILKKSNKELGTGNQNHTPVLLTIICEHETERHSVC
jgi:hypothetical protein